MTTVISAPEAHDFSRRRMSQYIIAPFKGMRKLTHALLAIQYLDPCCGIFPDLS